MISLSGHLQEEKTRVAKKKQRRDPTNITRNPPPSIIHIQEKAVSVFLIPEFDCSPPEYAINFENKSTAGFHPRYFFPSGKVDKTDMSPEASAMRECEEEAGIKIIDLKPSDLIGKLRITDHETGDPVYVYIYTKCIPSNAKVRPGSEQIEVLRLRAEDIEKLITGNFMGVDHVEAWQLYKQSQSKRSRHIRKK